MGAGRLSPVTLTGSLVRLEPLSLDHLDGLIEATNDGQMYDRWYTPIPHPDTMAAGIQQRLTMQEGGSMMPFTTIRQSDDVVLGGTTYCDIQLSVPRVEIGYTWNRASAHGTGTNVESKLMLMTYAFETLDCAVVKFSTHWMNEQSKAAIERLGAQLEAVLRADKRDSEGRLRDSVVYSVIAPEWPMVKTGLRHR